MTTRDKMSSVTVTTEKKPFYISIPIAKQELELLTM